MDAWHRFLLSKRMALFNFWTPHLARPPFVMSKERQSEDVKCVRCPASCNPEDKALIPRNPQTLKFQSPREIPDHLLQQKSTHRVELPVVLVLRIIHVLCLLAGAGAPRSVEAEVTLPIVALIVVETPVNVIMSIQPAGLHLHQGIELVMIIVRITVSVHAHRLEDTVPAHVLLHQWKSYLEEILEKFRKFRLSLRTNSIG